MGNHEYPCRWCGENTFSALGHKEEHCAKRPMTPNAESSENRTMSDLHHHKEGKMSAWTHSQCYPCWVERNGEKEPVTGPRDKVQKCCFCGRMHSSGIYVRGDPMDSLCQGKGHSGQENPKVADQNAGIGA